MDYKFLPTSVEGAVPWTVPNQGWRHALDFSYVEALVAIVTHGACSCHHFVCYIVDISIL